MALSDLLGNTSLTEALAAQKNTRSKARADALAANQTDNPFFNAANSIVGNFGGGLIDGFVKPEDSPEVDKARRVQGVMEAVSALEETPGTPEHLTAQARLLNDAGFTGEALSLADQSAKLRTSLTSTARTQGRQDASDLRAESAASRAVFAHDRAAQANDRAVADEARKDTRLRLAVEQCELNKAKAGIKDDKKAKSKAFSPPGKADLASASASLEESGITAGFLNPGFGDDQDLLDSLTARVAAGAAVEHRLRADKGEDVTRAQVEREIAQGLLANPAFATDGGGFFDPTLSNEVKLPEIDAILDGRVDALNGPVKRKGVLKL